MTKRNKLKAIQESDTGLNTRFIDPSTKEEFTLKQAVKAVESGKYSDYHVVEKQGIKFIRSNPDGKKSNNLE